MADIILALVAIGGIGFAFSILYLLLAYAMHKLLGGKTPFRKYIKTL